MMKIVAFGDSTTAPRDRVATYADQLLDRIGPENVTILNKGVGGNTTQAAMARFQRDVADHKPEVVIVQFGINDSSVDVWDDPPKTTPRVSLADYEIHIRHFVVASRALGAEVILMTPNQLRWSPRTLERYGKPPYDREDRLGFNLLLAEYCEVVRQVAREEKVQLVDIYAAYHDLQRSADAFLLDGMHPNTDGHSIVADALEPVLRSLLANRNSSRETFLTPSVLAPPDNIHPL